MRLREFEKLLDRRGAGLDRWPAGERVRAEALLADSAAAREMLQRAERLEALLRQPAAPAGAALHARIAAIAATAPQQRPAVRQRRLAGRGSLLDMLLGPARAPAFAAVAALMLSAAVGLGLGAAGIGNAAAGDDPIEIAALVYGAEPGAVLQ